ncbi:MAG TPA: hypothetical protein VI670_02285 [Thermoanaerobaculia bacterium]|jgi:hypothetical protein
MIGAEHLHLAINHSPLYSEVFAFFVLLIGTIRRNRTLTTTGLVFAIVAGICGAAAYWTGNAAADVLQKATIAGVDTQTIGLHELAAKFGLAATAITGVAALVALRWRRRWLEIVIIILALWSVTVIVRVALLGGRIHHPEVRAVVRG